MRLPVRSRRPRLRKRTAASLSGKTSRARIPSPCLFRRVGRRGRRSRSDRARPTNVIGSALTLELKDSDFVFGDATRRRHSVSAKQLAIPEKAVTEYQEAQKELARRDVEAAVKHLERAVEIAPQFATAWNNLGTIAYQTRKYARAEECFREALAQAPETYEALVNLGACS